MAITELNKVRSRRASASRPSKDAQPAARSATTPTNAGKPAAVSRGAARARAQDMEKLDALKHRLHEDMAILTQQDGDRTPYGGDFESLVTAAQLASQHETDELLRRRLERRLSELDHVQRRLEQGSYGKCEQCGEQIPEERLEAMPDTTMCVPCQRTKERARFGSWRRAA
jgi:DnaK suppressor protein